MKQTKKIMALALAASMMFAPIVQAADGETEQAALTPGTTIDGTGENQGYVNKKVTDVILPTTAADGLDFKTDPQGLLTQTNPTDYKLGAGAVYFPGAGKVGEGDAATYSNVSKKFVVTNKSSYPITVTPALTATVTGVTLVDSPEALLSTEDPSLYFGFITNEDTESIQTYNTSESKFVIKDNLLSAVCDTTGIKDKDGKQVPGYCLTAGADTSAFLAAPAPVHDKSNKYTYGILSDYEAGSLQKVTYQITAACDINAAAWDSVSTAPKLKLAWTLKETTPSGADDNKTLTWDRTGDMTFTVDGSVTFVDIGVSVNGKIFTYTGNNKFNAGNTTLAVSKLASVEGNTITLKQSLSQYLPAGANLYLITSADSNDASATKIITIN